MPRYKKVPTKLVNYKLPVDIVKRIDFNAKKRGVSKTLVVSEHMDTLRKATKTDPIEKIAKKVKGKRGRPPGKKGKAKRGRPAKSATGKRRGRPPGSKNKRTGQLSAADIKSIATAMVAHEAATEARAPIAPVPVPLAASQVTETTPAVVPPPVTEAVVPPAAQVAEKSPSGILPVAGPVGREVAPVSQPPSVAEQQGLSGLEADKPIDLAIPAHLRRTPVAPLIVEDQAGFSDPKALEEKIGKVFG